MKHRVGLLIIDQVTFIPEYIYNGLKIYSLSNIKGIIATHTMLNSCNDIERGARFYFYY